MKIYCPLIGHTCEDGHPFPDEPFCLLWDTIYDLCLHASTLRKTYEALLQAQETFRRAQDLIGPTHPLKSRNPLTETPGEE